MQRFRTRQAPSPTGYLHIGTARQVLFTKLLAMHEKGEWYMRLEDTDRNRLVADAAVAMLQVLSQLGLEPEEGISLEGNGKKDDFWGIYQKGDKGPYIQSQRLPIYHEKAQELIEKGMAYWNFLTNSEKEELRAAKQVTKKPIDYYTANREKYGKENMQLSLQQGLAHKSKPALYYHIHRVGSVVCNDLLLGETVFDLCLEEDFVIIKNDGYPTYHFAHVIDDHEMETTHIIRAQEWYASLPKHVIMFQEIWGTVPAYIHVPFILAPTGTKKLSKRDGTVDVRNFLEKGILPEALLNYLAFLGWNPGTEKEPYLNDAEIEKTTYSLQERLETLFHNLSEDFTIDTLSKSPARMNEEKMLWFNREYIKRLPLLEYLKRANELNPTSIDHQTLQAWELCGYLLDQNRATTLVDVSVESPSVLNWNVPQYSILAWKAQEKSQVKQALVEIMQQVILPFYENNEAASVLEQQKELYSNIKKPISGLKLSNRVAEIGAVWEHVLKDWLKAYQKDTGSYLWPLRVALSAQKQSASPFELLAILPPDEVKKRIVSTIESL